MSDPLKNFLFIDQLKIMGYGESDTSGCWVKFQITPELIEVIRGRKGEMVEVAARLIDNAGEYVPLETSPAPTEVQHIKGPHGKFWYDLIRHGVFNAPPVLNVIGSDAAFQNYVREQPSCLSGQFDYNDGEARCEFAHVRRISEGAGVAIKPSYFGVPLTHDEHFLQHQEGEASALEHYGPQGYDHWTPDTAQAWFEKQARKYRLEWATKTLAKKLGYGSRSDCPPEAVLGLVQTWKLEPYFPSRIIEMPR